MRHRTSLLTLHQHGVSPKDPLSPKMKVLRYWILAFKTEKTRIQTGIRQRKPESDRASVLNNAIAALSAFQIEQADSFSAVLTMLEDKLSEMLSVLSGSAKGQLRAIALPDDLVIDEDAFKLSRKLPIAERSFLFEGGMREILFEYRDHGNALVAGERTRLYKNLRTAVDQVATVVRDLNSHLVLQQFLDEDQHQRIQQMLATGQELQNLYGHALQSDDGIKSLLQANGFEIRTQFTVASAKLCLQLFGHVSPDILKALLQLKSVDYLHRWDSNHVEPLAMDAERKRLDRDIKSALKGMTQRALRENWPVLPVLQLYDHKPEYGRAPALAVASLRDEGLPSQVSHTEV